MSATDSLDAMLKLAEATIRDAQQHEHENGLASRSTRRYAGDLLRSLRRWRHATEAAERSATVCNSTAATAPSNGQPTAGQQHTTCQGAPTVPASPTVGVRIPPALLERAEDQAHREDRTLSQVIRRALAAHLADADTTTERRAA